MEILFVCALFLEAKPLIQHFNLKKKENLQSFQLFENLEEKITLIVTGVGKINSSVGTILALQKVNKKIIQAVNIGLCGSKKEDVGKMFLINKISDFDTERDFYPDNLLENNLQQKKLLTVSKPFDLEKHKPFSFDEDLIDMEGSAFFESASFYLSTNRIFLLKIVSDNLDQKKLDKKLMEEIISNNIEHLSAFIETLKQMPLPEADFFVINTQLLENLFSQVHFTATEQVQIKNYLRDICLNEEISLADFLSKNEEVWQNQKTSLAKGEAAFNFIQKYRREMFVKN